MRVKYMSEVYGEGFYHDPLVHPSDVFVVDTKTGTVWQGDLDDSDISTVRQDVETFLSDE